MERLHLKPLPAWIPEVYRLHQRMVDVEGYVALHTNRYSVPLDWIGRRVEVRETKDKIEIQLDARNLVTHRRIAEAEHQRVMLAAAPPAARARASRVRDPHPEEKAILAAVPEIADYVAALKQRSRKVPGLPCANCCAWCASIRENRCWPRCGKPPAMVSTTWTGSNA